MKKEKKIKIAKIILKTVAAADIISMIILAPNALQCLDMFYDRRKRKYNPKYYIQNTIGRLKNQGLIKFETKNGKKFVRLTEKGEKELLKYQLQELVVKKPKKWDEKWRVIIFDIKEKRRKTRDELRRELNNLGFIKLQNSVWVYPYECEEIIIMLKAYYLIGKDVLYMTVEKIENDRWLKEEFKLK
ncbi:CRISPR-associated endonuclease Cas2 [Patescibacteria group bacterium]|nr:CRISPR-associated endonuclease Cas2 [Patescibacteria group bacterium]